MAIAVTPQADQLATTARPEIPDKPPSIAILIPAFNEAGALGSVLQRLASWQARGCEIIVVDDGSTDGTGDIARAANVQVIRNSHNRGYGASLKTGIRATNADIVITLDSDGQHDPDDISRLLEAMGDNDLVVGARGRESFVPVARRPGKWALGVLANYLSETKIPDLNSGLRAMRRETALKFLNILPNGFSFSTTITLAFLKEGLNVAYVPIVAKPRAGSSTVNPLRDGMQTILLIIRVIMLFDPLKVFLPVSLILFLIGASYWIADMVIRARINIPSGAVILFVSGVIVFMFGILADQISAMRRERNS